MNKVKLTIAILTLTIIGCGNTPVNTEMQKSTAELSENQETKQTEVDKKTYQKILKLAKQGDAKAQFDLAMMYIEDDDKLETSLEWLKKSANSGHAEAQFELGTIYYVGALGFEQDFNKAYELFVKSANQGNINAINNVGVMYSKGKGVKQDYHKAKEWFEKGAKLGNVVSEYSIGYLYFTGTDTFETDMKLAYKWFSKSADKGYAKSEYYLGLMYYKGYGVSQNYQTAYQWLDKAVKQGNGSATLALSLMYAQGKGVQKDTAKATKLAEQAQDMISEVETIQIVLLFADKENIKQQRKYITAICSNGKKTEEISMDKVNITVGDSRKKANNGNDLRLIENVMNVDDYYEGSNWKCRKK